MVKVLVVGQTPPPYGGQAMMIERLANGVYQGIKIYHVRMAFSDQVKSIGKFSFHKIKHLFTLIRKIYGIRIREKHLILYYPPAGPDFNPIIRDLILLFFVRPFFKKTVYHFRAAGISEYLQTKSKFFQSLCKTIYGSPNVGIQLSALNPKDADYFCAKKVIYVPNGLEDEALNYLPITRLKKDTDIINLLFVGVLREDKGLTCLVKALQLLNTSGTQNFNLTVMGDFTSDSYRKEVTELLREYGLTEKVQFVGTKTKSDKWDCFLAADMLCFPTFFNSESFGNVLLEAMMFELPVIATFWRGIPDIVNENTGILVQINNEKQLAEGIKKLIVDNQLRLQMGKNGRAKYLEQYSLKKHLLKMENVFLNIN